MTDAINNPEKTTKMYWLQTITPLHVGSGKGVGFIDMPIMRETVTEWPYVPGSAVKGVMRDHFDQFGNPDQKKWIGRAFGTEGRNLNANAGSIVLTDAHIVCLPVRSLYGTFAYVTCPMALARLTRDLKAAGYSNIPLYPTPTGNQAFCKEDSKISDNKNAVFFEDLDFVVQNVNSHLAEEWAKCIAKSLFPPESKGSEKDPKNPWYQIFLDRFVIISDDCFNFLAETGTEVAAHIRIDDDRKIVANHMLWYEESLPGEAILAGIAWCDRVYGDKNGSGVQKASALLNLYCLKDTEGLEIQIGGKANVGKGRVRCIFTEGGNSA